MHRLTSGVSLIAIFAVVGACGNPDPIDSDASGTSEAGGSSGEATSGDGDMTGDGDGTSEDATTGDGTTGDGTTGDGDGDGTTGDGTTGDGDGTTGDGTTGDGDGVAGDWDAPPYLMWGAQTEISLLWEDKTPTIGRVEYGPGFASSLEDTSARTLHEFRLTGLTPGTQYSYRIRSDSGVASPAHSFWTAPDDGDDAPFTFLVWGDNQDGPGNFVDNVANMVQDDARFAVSVGDCVQNGTRAEYRSQLLVPIAPLARNVPFLVGQGNHELYSDPGAALFEEYMAQPGDEHCFGARYGSVYIQYIDTEQSISVGSAQNDCIVAGLTSPEALSATYRAAAFHKPPRIEWWFGGTLAFPTEMEAPWVRNELEPLLESLDVHVVFNGHNHLYAHTPETPGGIVWLTTGGGGGMLDTDFALWNVGDWPEIATTIHEHHYLRVSVSPSAMIADAIGLNGSVLHSATILP